MLPRDELRPDISGLTDEMMEELEARITEFEDNFEVDAQKGGAGYVEKIRQKDIVFAGTINFVITVYMIVAVFVI